MSDGREERAVQEARREWEKQRRNSDDHDSEYDSPEGGEERGGS